MIWYEWAVLLFSSQEKRERWKVDCCLKFQFHTFLSAALSLFLFFYPWANQKPVNCPRNKKLCDRFICAYHSKDNWAKRDSGKYYMGTHTCTVQQRWHQGRLLISLPAVKTAEELQFYYTYYGFLIYIFLIVKVFFWGTLRSSFGGCEDCDCDCLCRANTPS